MASSINLYIHSQRTLFTKYYAQKQLMAIRKMKSYYQNKIVLDVGCGSGILYKILQPHVKEIYLCDIKGKPKFSSNNFQICDATYLPYKANTFDSIYLLGVIEHTSDPMKVFQSCMKVLQPSGHLLISIADGLFWKILGLFGLLLNEQRKLHCAFNGQELMKIASNTLLIKTKNIVSSCFKLFIFQKNNRMDNIRELSNR